MNDGPLTGPALQQQILLAKGAAYLAAALLAGFAVLVSVPGVLVALTVRPALLFYLFGGVAIWLTLLFRANRRFEEAADVGDRITPAHTAEPEEL